MGKDSNQVPPGFSERTENIQHSVNGSEWLIAVRKTRIG
jgi:hypothetical protein